MPRKERVQVLLSQEELERFRRHASAAGTSLSNWLREAGLRKADDVDQRERLDTPAALRGFFGRCDLLEDGTGTEPDWDEVKKLIAEGMTKGLPRP
jgi:hypothetical protein